jgi:hypothetical protein
VLFHPSAPPLGNYSEAPYAIRASLTRAIQRIAGTSGVEHLQANRRGMCKPDPIPSRTGSPPLENPTQLSRSDPNRLAKQGRAARSIYGKLFSTETNYFSPTPKDSDRRTGGQRARERSDQHDE